MDSAPALAISAERLEELLVAHIAASLPPEKMAELAERHVEKRIGMLTLEQARKHLQCPSEKRLTDFCREQKIPIVFFGPKKRFILISEIEAAQKRAKLHVPDGSSIHGTKVETTRATATATP